MPCGRAATSSARTPRPSPSRCCSCSSGTTRLMSREAGLALWDAFGSAEKTMHVNPGPHVGIPLFERDAAAAFYRRHLGA